MNEAPTTSTPPPQPPRGAPSPRRALLVSVVGILALVGVVAVLVLVFRGSEDDLEAYFADAEPILSTVNARTSEGQYTPTTALVHISTVLRDTSETLDAISPPDEVGEAHSALVAALEEEAVMLSDLASEELEAETSEELSRLLAEDEELSVIVDRVTQSCLDIKAAAEDNEIEVELDLC